MILLDTFLKKSKAPYTQADITELLQLYGQQLKLLTRANSKGELGAFALLSAPMRMLGKTVCNVVAAGTDGTLDARGLFEELKQTAREWGADTLMAATFRNPDAVAKRFGATIDSVNLRWDLTEDAHGTSPTLAQPGPRGEFGPAVAAVRGPGSSPPIERTAGNDARPRYQQHRRKSRLSRPA